MSATSGPSTPPVVAVGAIVTVDDHLLLVTRASPPALGQWTVPGGRVEPGERMTDAVVREVAEETGLAVECGPLVGWVERINTGFHYIIFDFWATPVGAADGQESKAFAPVAGDDAGQARWVPVADLARMDLVPGLLDFLLDHGILDGA